MKILLRDYYVLSIIDLCLLTQSRHSINSLTTSNYLIHKMLILLIRVIDILQEIRLIVHILEDYLVLKCNTQVQLYDLGSKCVHDAPIIKFPKGDLHHWYRSTPAMRLITRQYYQAMDLLEISRNPLLD